MDERHVLDKNVTLEFTNLQFLAAWARVPGSKVNTATESEILAILNNLPEEINVIFKETTVVDGKAELRLDEHYNEIFGIDPDGTGVNGTAYKDNMLRRARDGSDKGGDLVVRINLLTDTGKRSNNIRMFTESFGSRSQFAKAYGDKMPKTIEAAVKVIGGMHEFQKEDCFNLSLWQRNAELNYNCRNSIVELEKAVGIDNLHAERRELDFNAFSGNSSKNTRIASKKDRKNKKKTKGIEVSENKAVVSMDYRAEVVGNFKTDNASLSTCYLLNVTGLREAMISTQILDKLNKSAIKDNLVRPVSTLENNPAYAALLYYFNAIDRADYIDKQKSIVSIRWFIRLVSRIKRSNITEDEIDKIVDDYKKRNPDINVDSPLTYMDMLDIMYLMGDSVAHILNDEISDTMRDLAGKKIEDLIAPNKLVLKKEVNGVTIDRTSKYSTRLAAFKELGIIEFKENDSRERSLVDPLLGEDAVNFVMRLLKILFDLDKLHTKYHNVDSVKDMPDTRTDSVTDYED